GRCPGLGQLWREGYWSRGGGAGPAAVVRRQRERAVYFHFKDGDRTAEGKAHVTELGRGEVDLKAALSAALESDPGWIVYEQDRSKRTPTESVRESRAYMRDALGI